MSCDLLKLHNLVENGGDNKKRKEMILTILGRDDLQSMLNGTRSKPIATSANPTETIHCYHDCAIREPSIHVPNCHNNEKWNIATSIQFQKRCWIYPFSISSAVPTMTSWRHRIGFAAGT